MVAELSEFHDSRNHPSRVRCERYRSRNTGEQFFSIVVLVDEAVGLTLVEMAEADAAAVLEFC